MNLSPNQQEIVDFKEGALLVEAGPGSGKTRVLIERIKKLLTSQRRGRILALTFSNLAADEMKQRLSEDAAIVDQIDRVNVGTIHSFCLDLVQTRGNLIGLSSDLVIFENDEDRRSVLKSAYFDNPQLKHFLENYSDKKSIMQRSLQLISENKRQFISPEECCVQDPFPLVYSEYNQKLLEQNALDFDDILFYAYRILAENPSVVRLYNSLYKYICVDEAQDLNFAQYQTIKALCGDAFSNIMLVGDANQSIYGFNGSNSDYMSKAFIEDFHPKVFKLNENYRSAKRIVAFANKLEHYDSVTNYVYDGELSAFKLDNEEAEAGFVADKMQYLIENGHPDVEGKITYDRIAIIARNRYALNAVEKELTRRDIPYFYKKGSVGLEIESDYMSVFDLCIRLIINPKDYVHLTQLKGLVGNKAVIRLDDGKAVIQKALQGTKYEVMIPVITSLKPDAIDLKKVLVEIESVLSAINDDERYLVAQDIKQWKKHWNKYCFLVAKENRSLISFRNQVSLGKTKEDEGKTGVSMLTAHMSKGLQFDVVFIVGLSEGTFPDYRAVRSGNKELAQELNNMYVAVTRAKRLCYMTYPEWKKMPWGGIKHQIVSRYIRSICI